KRTSRIVRPARAPRPPSRLRTVTTVPQSRTEITRAKLAGERRADSRTTFAVDVRPSRIDGRGVFAAQRIPARAKVGELAGQLISQREARRRAKRRRRIAIVEFDDGGALDASVGGNEFRYVNHSCTPNTFIRRIARHVEFYAKRNLAAAAELPCASAETPQDG